jgi:hypothetical protein
MGISLCLVFVGAGVYFICFIAPNMPTPNLCRQFILISPLYQPDPWGEKAQAKLDSEPSPWWVHLLEYGSYVVILCCMVWPPLGFIVLFIIAMWMMWRFIQKTTETGPYARQTEEGGEI